MIVVFIGCGWFGEFVWVFGYLCFGLFLRLIELVGFVWFLLSLVLIVVVVFVVVGGRIVSGLGCCLWVVLVDTSCLFLLLACWVYTLVFMWLLVVLFFSW